MSVQNKEQLKADAFCLYVSPTGSDGWSGLRAQPDDDQQDGPLASVSAARDRLRILRREGRIQGAVEVVLLPGVHQCRETLRLTDEDLGDADTPVRYRSAHPEECAGQTGETVVIGGVQLQGFEPHDGAVVKVNLAAHGLAGRSFRQVLVNGERMQQARYPNYVPSNPYGAGWLYVEGPLVNMYDPGHGQKDRFICRDPRLASWKKINEVEVFVFPRFNWVNDRITIKHYDPETGEVVLSRPASYEIYPGDRLYFQNVAEELDAPGEWYSDGVYLYLYPPCDLEQALVTVSLVEHLWEVEAEAPIEANLYKEKIDWMDGGGFLHRWPSPQLAERGYWSAEGITFDGCEGSAVVMRGLQHGALIGCTIRNTGASGVTVLGGFGTRIEGCDIYATGSHGLYVSGGLRTTFSGVYMKGEIEIVNNYVHHVGCFLKNSAGIAIHGCGIRVAHNLIHDGPRWGILSRGNDHLIEYNHIRHVNIETSDTAAIYLVDREWTMRGTVIRYNHIHDILGYHREKGVWRSPAYAFGIYLDDWTSGVTIHGNLIYRTPSASVYINSGQENIVTNNVMIGGREEVFRCFLWQAWREKNQVGTADQGMRRNHIASNIIVSPNGSIPPLRFRMWEEPHGEEALVSNTLHNNLLHVLDGSQPCVRIENTHIDWEQWLVRGNDQGSVIGDPQFIDPDNNDYTLPEAGIAADIGFEALPVDKMGPYADSKRASWPIIEQTGTREQPLEPIS